MKTSIVTGGAGFLGSHLCDRLTRENHHVVCIDNLVTGRVENIAHLLENRNFKFCNYDVTNYLFVDGTVDFIFHLASPASPVDYMRLPIETLKVGSIGTHHALGLAKAKKARFLLASTSEVYGDPLVHPQPEIYLGNVNSIGYRSVYDESKRFGEALTMAYNRSHRLETRIVRIFNTYGERMQIDDGRVIPTLMCQAIRGEELTVFGDGSQTRSICYVSDLIEGIYRLMMSDYCLPVNIGSTEEIKIGELAMEINEMAGGKSRIVFKELPEDDPKLRRPDISRAMEVLGWRPRVERAEGLKRTMQYFRQKLASC